jgi:glycosyltransferase involved in cell wall biosynthesis
LKLSVITPVKNGEQFLSDTIESVLGQKGDFSLEYIIIDGGSVDGTLGIISKYKEDVERGKYMDNCKNIELKLVLQPDESMYQAVSMGLKLADGDIICYINSDDFYFPNAFSTIANVFSKYKDVKWITGYPVRYNTKGEVIRVLMPFQYKTPLIKQGFYGTTLPFIQQESVFWRKELNAFLDLNELENFKLAGDYFIWHSFASNEQNLFLVESLLSGNRLRSGQLSEDKVNYFKEFNSIKSKPRFTNKLKAFGIKAMEKLAGTAVKRALSGNRIVFRDGEWVKK